MTPRPDPIASALEAVFVSPNVCDSNWEAANLVDTTASLAKATRAIAEALAALEAELGGVGLSIASALHAIARAIGEHGSRTTTTETPHDRADLF